MAGSQSRSVSCLSFNIDYLIAWVWLKTFLALNGVLLIAGWPLSSRCTLWLSCRSFDCGNVPAPLKPFSKRPPPPTSDRICTRSKCCCCCCCFVVVVVVVVVVLATLTHGRVMTVVIDDFIQEIVKADITHLWSCSSRCQISVRELNMLIHMIDRTDVDATVSCCCCSNWWRCWVVIAVTELGLMTYCSVVDIRTVSCC